MLSFLNINSVPWIASGILLLGLLFYRGEYLHEQTLRANDIKLAQEKLLEQKAKDEALAREIQDRYNIELAKLKEAHNGRVVSIMRAQNSNVCVGSAPVNAFLDGLRRDGQTSPVQDKSSK